jgi:hypothetical protein
LTDLLRAVGNPSYGQFKALAVVPTDNAVKLLHRAMIAIETFHPASFPQVL